MRRANKQAMAQANANAKPTIIINLNWTTFFHFFNYSLKWFVFLWQRRKKKSHTHHHDENIIFQGNWWSFCANSRWYQRALEQSSATTKKKTLKILVTNRDLVFVVQLRIMNTPQKGVLFNGFPLACSSYGIEKITKKCWTSTSVLVLLLRFDVKVKKIDFCQNKRIHQKKSRANFIVALIRVVFYLFQY